MKRYLHSAFLGVDVDLAFFMAQSSKAKNNQVLTFHCVGLVPKYCIIYINGSNNSSV